MGKRTTIVPAADHPCAACPWLISNHGKRTADGWYTKANRRRLWGGLRTGEMMSCHATDPANPPLPGRQAVPEGTPTKECAGAHVLLQRELRIFEALTKRGEPDPHRTYREGRRLGATREGLWAYLSGILAGGTILAGGRQAPPLADLDAPVAVDEGVLPWPPPAHLRPDPADHRAAGTPSGDTPCA